MTLHPLTPKGGAFVLKLGLVFNKNNTPPGVLFLLQEMGFEPSKCNSPVDYCRRRLDGGDPLSALCADADESLTLRQIITVILIQRNDGYFMPKISILLTLNSEKMPKHLNMCPSNR